MKRFSLISILLVLVVVLIVPACQKKDDFESILGTWDFTLRSTSSTSTETHQVVFTQTFTVGSWTMDVGDNETIDGTFQVRDGIVTMTITKVSYENGVTGSFTGQFETDDKMSGDWSVSDNGGAPNTGTWTAVRK